MKNGRDQWSKVDDYINELLVRPDRVLDEALKESRREGLPQISVSAPQGKLLNLLAKSVKAQNILEIGTLGGYSTIWLAKALPPNGRLITLEIEPKHAEIAKKNIAKAGLSKVVEIRLGNALDSLQHMVKENIPAFDLIFIDADKEGYPNYFNWSLRLSHAGTLIIADNVVRNGGVIDSKSKDPDILGVRKFNDLLAKEEPRVSSTVIQTVGAKGYDGFAIARVN